MTLAFSDADAKVISDYAALNNLSVFDFVRQTIFNRVAAEKEKHNAAYSAMLEKSREQLREGKVVIKTMSELEAMAKE